MKRPKIGDVIEIDTGVGLAYCHYSHKDKLFGHLMRVFSYRYSERPLDFDSVVAGVPTYHQFFPLGAAVQRGIVTIVGHVQVSREASHFPRFREVHRDRDGRITDWWIWDGEESRHVGSLTDEIRSLSPLNICTDIVLIDNIVSGWTPETDPELSRA